MRHGDSEGKIESGITKKGQCQVKQASAFLASIGLTGYQVVTAATPRCIDYACLSKV